jgi:phosphatidyl-myo-inositol dimannoside synthase
MSSLRALVVTPDFPPEHGGIQLVAHRLVSNLEGIACRVLTLRTPGAEGWDQGKGLDVRRVSAWPDRRVAVLRLNAAAVAEAHRWRPDLVLVLHIVGAPAAAVIAQTRHVPVVTYVHASEVAARPKMAAFAMRRSDRIVAVSRYTAGLATAAGADPQRIAVIPPGIDWRRPAPAERRTTPTVVTVARLEDRYKGHDVMVRAMPLVRSRVPGAEWVVVGEGSLRADIERMAVAHRVRDAIRLCGTVTDAERDGWLDRSHVFAMPSRLAAGGQSGEGFGIAYLEAGVHGLPVVAGGVGGALDAVGDGKTGLLVDPTDHVAVADAITGLLLDREAAATMGAAGREHARSFAWPDIAGRVGDLLEDTVRRS